MGKQSGTKSQVVRIRYTLIGNSPNKRKIAKTISKMGDKGFELKNQTDEQVGCLTLWFSMFLARGSTYLTFVKQSSEDQ